MSKVQRTVSDDWKDQGGPNAVERRSGKDRRRLDRRKVDIAVKVDRRRGKDRRSAHDRRECPLS